MPLESGSHLGPYEILAPIGAGGMGEVYRARDTRLDRTVAIKVLPSHLSGNDELRQRFEQEARAVSSLNHPHICTLHDIGHENGIDFLVMELIEGENLADRLAKGPLPFEEALGYGIEIADALDKAHRKGVVHRDLKPGNLMLTASGTKLLDFGLAKLQRPPSPSDISALPTEAKPLTQEGSIIGTFQYMAPEQLEGHEADARTDIFAWGSVLYEMLTGRKAFEGKSHASLIAAILERDPAPLSQIQPIVPRALDRVVKKCLAKDPDARWQSASDLADELKWIVQGGAQVDREASTVTPRRDHERWAWGGLTLVLAGVIVSLAAGVLSRRPAEESVTRFTVSPPPDVAFTTIRSRRPMAVSPDGRQLAFIATDRSGKTLLWVRSFDGIEASPLAGTEDAGGLFWSPDSRSLGFFAEAKLKTVGITGGPPLALCSSTVALPGAWGQKGDILFTQRLSGPIYRVSDAGGAPAPLTTLDTSAGETGHYYPQFLPDGRHFLYFVRNVDDAKSGTYVGALDSPLKQHIKTHASRAMYSPPGYLLFNREKMLLGQSFDVQRLELMGVPVPITETAVHPRGHGAVSVSQNGVLAYMAPHARRQEMRWYDREGHPIGSITAPEGAQNPEISPDGKRLVLERRDPETGARDLWVQDLSRDVASRLTFEASDDSDPLWSRDGKYIFFASNRGGMGSIYKKLSSGAGEDELVFQAEPPRRWPNSLSPDGQQILYMSEIDLWLLPLAGERTPTAFLDTEFMEIEGQFSPDGKWVSYSSDETGRLEVYVQRYPPTGGKWQISTRGGTDARWAPDGKELVYLAPDRTLMSVQLETAGTAPMPSTPRPLFQTRISGPLGPGVRFNFVVGTDGERFLIVSDTEEASPSPIIVVLNFTAELEQ